MIPDEHGLRSNRYKNVSKTLHIYELHHNCRIHHVMIDASLAIQTAKTAKPSKAAEVRDGPETSVGIFGGSDRCLRIILTALLSNGGLFRQLKLWQCDRKCAADPGLAFND